MNLTGKTVLVVGAARSGIEACRFLLTQHARIILSDSKDRSQLDEEVLALEKKGVKLMLGRQFANNVTWDLVVCSPGVPPMIPLLNISRAAGVEVIGEIELCYRYAKAPFIGITGTNGKTTTTALLGYILEQAGKNILLGGNIGKPLVLEAASFDGDYIVAELSSFQLETCSTFCPHIGLYLNLTPDHLDRHGNMENYAEAKMNLFVRQSRNDFAVLNADDEYVAQTAKCTAAKPIWFSLEKELHDGMFYNGSEIVVNEQGRAVHKFAAADIFIKGRHNIQNVMAAASAAYAVGVSLEDIGMALRTFPGVEHRQETVCIKDGVRYVNDSKATNPDSTVQALNAFDDPMILLMGGYDKDANFLPIMELIKDKVKTLVIFGATLPKIKAAADQSGYKSYIVADDFADAVRQAKSVASAGDVVMLSPACASWDEFDNFEQRGERFKELVK